MPRARRSPAHPEPSTSSMIRATLRLFFALLLACVPSLAQSSDGAYWNEYPRPANATQFRGLGSVVMIETPTDYHFFSGQHRKWDVFPVTAPTFVGIANKQAVWRDGSTIYGYSSFSAKAAPLPVSPTATVNMGSLSSSWTTYVVDGLDVYAFSAFFGEWKRLACAATPTVSINSHMVTATEGGRSHAFSAFFGEWTTLSTQGVTATLVWRNGAFALIDAPGVIGAFSAYTNTWTTIGYPTANLAMDARDAYASLSTGGTDRLWFSALRGMFTFSNFPAGSSTIYGPSVAVVTTPSGQVFGYAPGSGVVSAINTLPNPSVQVAAGSFGGFAFVDDGVSLIGFSGLRGTATQAPVYFPSTRTLGDTAGFATGANGEGQAYSAIRGDWTQSPNLVASGITANFEVILRTTATGYQAYSARSGTFADLTTASGAVVMLTQGSIIGVRDGTGVSVFDARYGRWTRIDTAANPTFGTHRLVGIGHDGVNAHGFSMWTYEWETIPIQGTVVSQTVNSSIAYLLTSSHVYVYTATGSMNTFARFPEFSRFQVLGQPLQHTQTGNPGSFVIALLSLTDTELPSPFGWVRVDLNPMFYSLGFVPADGRLYSPIPTPDVPVLRGSTLYMQDVLLKPNGDIKLSNALAHLLW